MKKILWQIALCSQLFGENFDILHYNFSDSAIIFSVLGFVVFVLFLYLLSINKKLKKKNVKMFEINDQAGHVNHSEKSSLYFDLQEAFLYFFRTLNYEASTKNNTFLVQQNMVDINEFGEKQLPLRHFYGDYTDIINAIWHSANLLNENVEGELILVDIEIESFVQGRNLLFVHVGLNSTPDNEKLELFENFKNPKKITIAEQISKIKYFIERIDGAKFNIQTTNNKINRAITLSFPLLSYDAQKDVIKLHEHYENLNILIVIKNQEISETIAKNFSSFGINCVQDSHAYKMWDKLADGASCAFRALLIDTKSLGSLDANEMEQLIKMQEIYCFKVVVVLPNNKAILPIEKYLSELECLQLPYTIDTVRVLLNQIKAQQEKLRKRKA